MEQELQPFLENGYLTTLGRNKYLESKKTVRLNAAGQIESILYEGDYLKPIIRYTQLNKDKIGRASCRERVCQYV